MITIKRERVVALLDLDCFYAQVEAVRLGVKWEREGIVVLQWGMALGLSRTRTAIVITLLF